MLDWLNEIPDWARTPVVGGMAAVGVWGAGALADWRKRVFEAKEAAHLRTHQEWLQAADRHREFARTQLEQFQDALYGLTAAYSEVAERARSLSEKDHDFDLSEVADEHVNLRALSQRVEILTSRIGDENLAAAVEMVFAIAQKFEDADTQDQWFAELNELSFHGKVSMQRAGRKLAELHTPPPAQNFGDQRRTGRWPLVKALIAGRLPTPP